MYPSPAKRGRFSGELVVVGAVRKRRAASSAVGLFPAPLMMSAASLNRPIEGLTAKDFTITENNAPQTIKFCEYEKLPENTDFTPSFSTRKPVEAEVPKGPPLSQISPEAPGDIRYRNRRLLSLYFDMSAMPVGTGDALTR